MASKSSSAELRVHLTLKSRNKKTGEIPVSTTTAATCPDACPLRDNGCYALFLHGFWQSVTSGRNGGTWKAFIRNLAKIPAGQLWRMNQAGDLPGDRVSLDADKLAELAQANKGRRGFTYTHYSPTPHNLKAIAAAIAEGFVINLSANNLKHADRLAALGVAPVACVLPGTVDGNVTRTLETPAGRKVAVCPATYLDTNCKACGLCARADRGVIVGFPAHGAGNKRASAIAEA